MRGAAKRLDDERPGGLAPHDDLVVRLAAPPVEGRRPLRKKAIVSMLAVCRWCETDAPPNGQPTFFPMRDTQPEFEVFRPLNPG